MSLILAPTRSIIRPKPLLGTEIDRSHPLSRNLAGAWLMNEGAGTKVFDASGNGHTGTITGATWTRSGRGHGLYFDGNDYVTVSDPYARFAFNAGTGWTASFWHNMPLTGSTTEMSFLSKYAEGQFLMDISGTFYSSDIVQYSLMAWTTGGPGASSFEVWQSPSGWYSDRWRHLTFVVTNRGASGAEVLLYIDGSLVRSGSLIRDTGASTANLTIGYRPSSRYCIGAVDNLSIYNRALTPNEIASLYADPYQMFRRGNPVVLGASSANNYSFTINDGMGIGDDIGGAAAMLRGLSEAMGLGDDVSRAAAIQRAMSEAMGLTDTAARVATVLRALADSVGLTDETIEGAARQLVETINDAVGLTDAQSRLSVLVRAVADSLGMADAATTLAVLLRTISDAQGMTDGQTLARMIAVADDLGVSDEMGRIVAYLRGQSDSVGLSDTMTRLHAAVRQITDTEGLTDSYSTAWTVLRTIADTLGLTDAMIQEGTGALVRVINDVLGMVDAKTKLHAALRVLASTINTADSVSRLFAVSRVISDAEGITDGAYLGKVFTFAETIGISDEVTRLVAFLRTQDDTVGVLEAILKVSNVIRSLDDAIEMTDAEQHSLSGLVQAALAFLFLKKGR